MGQRSPLVTLAAAGVGLVALLVVDSTQAGGGTPAAVVTPAGTTSAPPSTPLPTSVPPSEPASVTPSSVTPPAVVKPVVYVGRTAGREATVAVAVKGERAVAYICDGVRLEAWLSGTVTGGQLALRSKTGERLTGAVSARSVVGELTLRGRTLRFTAAPAGPPAGLYRAQNSKSTIGWIVLPNGDQVGIDNDGTPAAAPRLDPENGQATADGVQVTANPVTGDEALG